MKMATFWQLTLGGVVVLLCFTSECQSAKAKPASSYFKICGRKNPDLNECIVENVNALRTHLIKGIPELRLPSLEPMFIPMMTLSEGQGNFRFAQTLKNLTIHGLSKYKIISTKLDYIDGGNMTITFDITTPHLRMNAEYEMDGQILVLPIRGSGDCVLHFSDVKTVSRTRGYAVRRGGKEFIEVSEVKWDISVGGANSTFNNLFNGDRTLGDATNRFLNDNWRDAFQTYKHLPEEAFGLVFKDLTNQVFKRYPIDELFLN